MKRFILCLLSFIFVFSMSGIAGATHFPDVTTDHTYYNAIEYIANEGIVQGYEDGEYKPWRQLERCELLKIVLEANYDYIPDNNVGCGFKDVSGDAWYSKYVCFAKELEIIKGYNDNTFRPRNYVEFIEALKMTERSYGIVVEEPADEWWREYVILGSQMNIIPLDVAGVHDPFNRGQMADMITRIIKYFDGSLDEYLGPDKDKRITYTMLGGDRYANLGYVTDIVADDWTEIQDDLTGSDSGHVKLKFKYPSMFEYDEGYGFVPIDDNSQMQLEDEFGVSSIYLAQLEGTDLYGYAENLDQIINQERVLVDYEEGNVYFNYTTSEDDTPGAVLIILVNNLLNEEESVMFYLGFNSINEYQEGAIPKNVERFVYEFINNMEIEWIEGMGGYEE